MCLNRNARILGTLWLVSYGLWDLDQFTLETEVLEPLENSFGRKLLPM